jgi:uncharacterized protein RhaS with RHS repeats
MNRYYHSALGRFMSPDPFRGSASKARSGSWNRYAYVEGDPANANDPSGLCSYYIGRPCSFFMSSSPTDKNNDGDEEEDNDDDGPNDLDQPEQPRPPNVSSSVGLSLYLMHRAIEDAVARAGDRVRGESCAGLFLAPDFNDAGTRRAVGEWLEGLWNANPNPSDRPLTT